MNIIFFLYTLVFSNRLKFVILFKNLQYCSFNICLILILFKIKFNNCIHIINIYWLQLFCQIFFSSIESNKRTRSFLQVVWGQLIIGIHELPRKLDVYSGEPGIFLLIGFPLRDAGEIPLSFGKKTPRRFESTTSAILSTLAS